VDYRTVEADYGTNEDFKVLIAAAHERGIDVIVDLVMNHTSSENPWFEDARTPGSAHDDWYVWATSGRQARAGTPTASAVLRAVHRAMPDLNLENPAVTAEIVDIARFG
jgi:glycosidase